jgi:hypothetical protein
MSKRNLTFVNNRKYIGRYVAMESFNNKSIIASGKDPIDVMARAERKGLTNPLVVFVPPKGAVNIF